MRLHRFYVPSEIGNQKKIRVNDLKLIHQWRDVFRYTTGAQVVLFDGSRFEFWAIIEQMNQDFADLRILELKEVVKKSKNAPKNHIYIAAAIIKNDNFDLILQKTTELGVSGIFPILTDRTIKKNINMDRSRRIVKEASEQCGRLDVPPLETPADLIDVLNSFEGKIIILQGGEDSKVFNKKMLNSNGSTLFVIGPEGGWSPKELELFKKNKYSLVSIGDNVLRAETAAISILALSVV